MEVVPGIHKLDLSFGCNVYLILGQTITLVDAGLPGNSVLIDRHLRSIGRRLDEISLLMITHFHPDHVGAAPELRHRTGCQVAIHEIEAPFVEGRQLNLSLGAWGPVGAALTLARRLISSPNAPVAVPVLDGDTVEVPGGGQVLHTPGHTPGSICLYLPGRRILFTGDALVHHRSGLQLSGFPVTADRQQGYRSLAGLATHNVETICFGHGSPIIGDGGQRLADFVQSRGVVKGV